MTLKSKIKGSIKLSAISDALGFMTEQTKTIDALEKRCGVSKVDEFYDWKTTRGRFDDSIGIMPLGSYSDDTQLMLAVARSIQQDGIVDQHYFAKREYASWWYYKRGAGSTISAAALRITRKSADWNNNFFTFKKRDGTTRDYRDCGANGAAMRTVPIALANTHDFDKMKKQIFGNSIITHGHPRAIIGALLYGYTIHEIFNHTSNTFDPGLFLKILKSTFKKKLKLPFLSKPEFKDWLSKWNNGTNQRDFISEYDSTLNETHKNLNVVYSNFLNGKSLLDTFTNLGSFHKPTKSYGTNTVLAAIYVFSKYHNRPEDGIVAAVNMIGSDTDTIASIVGGMLGAFHGEQIILNKWRSVQDYEYLDSIGDRIAKISSGEKIVLKPPNRSNILFDIKNGDYSKLSVGDKLCINPLGDGIIQDILVKSSNFRAKKRLYVSVKFEIGQTCTFTKLVDK